MLPNDQMTFLFDATIEAVQEAILNAMCAAETMHGLHETTEALPLDVLVELMKKYNRFD